MATDSVGRSPHNRRVVWGKRHAWMTDHAADQWDKRMPDNVVSPETAFSRGVEVPEAGLEMLDCSAHPRPARARVWAADSGETAIFIVDSRDNIPTVYRANSRYGLAERAYFNVLAREGWSR